MRKLLTSVVMAAIFSAPLFTSASVNLAINVVQYPALQRIPGYPVYYAPGLHANYFFYDGLYWVYMDDAWYASPWYDGPWDLVAIDSVPLFLLRVPVRYYVYRPVIFSGWVMNAPPRWDTVWGPGWARRHPNWQHWNRAAVPAPAPLPSYQRQFTRANYPNEVQRRELAQQHYRYIPHDPQVRRQPQAHLAETANRAPERSRPERQLQAHLERPAETRHNDMRTFEHEAPSPNRHSPPHEAQLAQRDRQAARVEAPRFESPEIRGRAEEREPVRNARPEHGGRPDRGNKSDKDEGHESGKHH
jgi:hypothetical protein